MPKGIFRNPQERIEKIRRAKLGVQRPPLTEEWKRKISESGKLSNAGKYERTPEMKERARVARLKQTFTLEQKQKSLDALTRAQKIYTGEKHHNWKGGITKENAKIRSSRNYAKWRKAVIERDNHTCVWCNASECKLEIDHIKQFAYYPELRFVIGNGRTLCIDCHKTTKTYGKKPR